MAPLSHIRVLDLSRVIAAPFSTQLLADFGAEVIKVERPGSGDDTRGWGPVYLDGGPGEARRDSSYFISANRGKKSITVDMSTPEGQEIVRKLACRSDVVVENFKVGSLARYGLDYESLAALNPRLIYASVTGYGQDGPYAAWPAYDLLMQGLSGFMSITGLPDAEPGGGPMRSGVPFADILAGIYAALGIVIAVLDREKTGRGQHIDVALLDALLCSMPNITQPYLLAGAVAGRTGNSNPNVFPNEVFRCADGLIILAVANDGQFRKLCEAGGMPEIARDPRFASNDQRAIHRKELTVLLETMLARDGVAAWHGRLSAVGVPCGPINTVAQAFADPQVVHRGLTVTAEHGSGRAIEMIANPMRLSGVDKVRPEPPPQLGAHTEETLSGLLGMTGAEIAALRARGIV